MNRIRARERAFEGHADGHANPRPTKLDVKAERLAADGNTHTRWPTGRRRKK